MKTNEAAITKEYNVIVQLTKMYVPKKGYDEYNDKFQYTADYVVFEFMDRDRNIYYHSQVMPAFLKKGKNHARVFLQKIAYSGVQVDGDKLKNVSIPEYESLFPFAGELHESVYCLIGNYYLIHAKEKVMKYGSETKVFRNAEQVISTKGELLLSQLEANRPRKKTVEELTFETKMYKEAHRKTTPKKSYVTIVPDKPRPFTGLNKPKS